MPDLISRARVAWSYLLTKLNAVSSIVLAYALANPSALSELKAQLPPELQAALPLAGLAWFALIQVAKAKAIKANLPQK